MLLTKKFICNYSDFYQDLSGYYIVFMNYIAALTLTTPQFLSENFSISPTLLYTITKKPKIVFCGTNAIEGSETPESPQK